MSKELAPKKPSNSQLLTQVLQGGAIQNQLEQALGEGKGAFMTSLLSVYSSSSKLLECNPADVVREALKSASLKLPIEPSLGLAYIIAYKGVPQFQLGYKGLIQLAMRSGVYQYINADAVYEGEISKNDRLSGMVELNGEKTSDKIVGFFAYCKTLNGFEKVEYWTVEEINSHAKKHSKTYNYSNSVWKSDFNAMALKTVLKAMLSVYGSLSIEDQMGLSQEDNVIAQGISSVSKKLEFLEPMDISDDEVKEVVEIKEPINDPY